MYIWNFFHLFKLNISLAYYQYSILSNQSIFCGHRRLGSESSKPEFL